MIKKKDFLKEYNIEKNRNEMGRTEFHLRQLLPSGASAQENW